MNPRLPVLLTLLCAMSSTSPLPAAELAIHSEVWGQMPDGSAVHLFTLTNRQGMTARITNYGGIVVSLTAPDREGRFADVVLGFDRLEPYLEKHPFFGCITGRFANRIGGAAFTLDGVQHQVTANSGTNHIHGGASGFDKKLWQATPRTEANRVALELRYVSPDGEEGFPGALDCTVTYSLDDENRLSIGYRATTDAPTVLNLTNHSYFNLAGEGAPSVLDHELTIPAESFTATDEQMIPTGELASLLGTAMDFTRPHRIGDRIEADFLPLRQGKGYDHNFILTGGPGLKLAARVRHAGSGRVMEVHTTEPAVQLYTANHLKNVVGKQGHRYPARSALCLETQHFPDTPNHSHFPSATLRPGEVFESTTTFRFSAE